MSSIYVAKKGSGVVALGSNGEVHEITDQAATSVIETLVKERQAAGIKLTQALKKHGFNSIDDDEPTEIIVRE